MTTSPATEALHRAVSIATRRERCFAPAQVTLTLHTPAQTRTAELRETGPGHPAPGWPELHLPTYTPRTPHDLTALTATYDDATADDATPRGLVLTITAPVIGYDFDDAYAWRYHPQTRQLDPMTPEQAACYFHEDTTILTLALAKAPYPTVPTLHNTNHH